MQTRQISYISRLDKILKRFFKKIIPSKFTYLAPNDYLGNVSFQLLSNDSDISNKKLGDPSGYCLAWVFWYLEMRITNEDIHPKKLVEKSIYTIIEKYPSNNSFLNFIRSYAYKLDKLKNRFLLENGIPEHYLYNLIMPDDIQDRILISLRNKLSSIIKERF